MRPPYVRVAFETYAQNGRRPVHTVDALIMREHFDEDGPMLRTVFDEMRIALSRAENPDTATAA